MDDFLEFGDPLIEKKRKLAYMIIRVENDMASKSSASKERTDLIGFRAQLRLELSQMWGFCK